ncbi:MAG TPA: acetolactate synthase small subunit [Actinomycetota bacterium]|nr:acetolactate synthase small subunit [Actinomycetota bacterium]
MKHTVAILVENKPGVLMRVASLFSRRGFNIHSLAVGPTENADVSRITVVVELPDKPLEHVTKQLHKLINVLKVIELEPTGSVVRELMLIKVRAEAGTRSQVFELAEVFRASIVDVTVDSVTAEVSGPPDKLAAFEDLVRGYGIIELVKSGRIALGRGARGIRDRQLRAAG